MQETDIIATFGPAAGDHAALSKASRATVEALFRHPIAHSLEWSDVVALFTELGTVDHRPHNETAFGLGGEHRVVRKPHGKELPTAEVMEFRHMLSRAGWSPHAAAEVRSAESDPVTHLVPADLLVVVEHHEARLYQLDMGSADPGCHTIRPYDPHRVLHHLSHKDHPRERGQRSPEDQGFYHSIAQALTPARAVVVIGHGDGHSNAAHHLVGYLRLHRPDIAPRVRCEIVADLSSLTPPQLLALGRRALSWPPGGTDDANGHELPSTGASS